MLSPKEKAKELVDMNIIRITQFNYSGFDATYLAKVIAEDTCNEIIKYIKYTHFKPEDVTENNLEYWKEVKIEITRSRIQIKPSDN